MESNNRNNLMSVIIFWALVITMALSALLILTIVFYPLFEGKELTFCIRLFMLLYVIKVFAVLRLYNSIVQNTRFIIKMRDSASKLRESFPALERAMRSLKSSNDNVAAKISVNSERIKRLTEEISSDIELTRAKNK